MMGNSGFTADDSTNIGYTWTDSSISPILRKNKGDRSEWRQGFLVVRSARLPTLETLRHKLDRPNEQVREN